MTSMKKKQFTSRWFALSALAAIFLFASCSKKNDVVNTPVAGLMAFNLAPDKPSVGIALSNNSLTGTPLAYTSFTGGYYSIYPGTRTVDSYDFYTGTPIANGSYNFMPSTYNSVFLVGANGTYKNVITVDNFDSLSTTNGQAYIRYINAIPDSSNVQVSVTAGGNNIIQESSRFTKISQFTGLTPGQITVTITTDGNVQASRVIDVVAQKAYTILLTGIPGSADPAKAMQIRFVENGQLAP